MRIFRCFAGTVMVVNLTIDFSEMFDMGWKQMFCEMMADKAYLADLKKDLYAIIGMSFDELMNWLEELIIRRLHDWFSRNPNSIGLSGEMLADFLLDVDYGTVMLWVDGVRYGDCLSNSPVWSVNPLYAPMKTVVFSVRLNLDLVDGSRGSIDSAISDVVRYESEKVV